MEIRSLAPTTPGGIQVARLLPIDQAGEAGVLISAGRADAAVAILDTVVHESSAQATRTADSLFPSALLAAGEEDLAHDAYLEAVSAIDQLVTSFPSSAEAALGQAMLAAPQSVTGTLVTHLGLPISDKVRLSSNYKAEPGGMYQTSGPFYTTTADASGDFSLSNVPVGGPYVLEVYADGNWTTLINPTTNQPADPVTVTPIDACGSDIRGALLVRAIHTARMVGRWEGNSGEWCVFDHATTPVAVRRSSSSQWCCRSFCSV